MIGLIQKHKALEIGEVFEEAVLVPEPTNAFDAKVDFFIVSARIGWDSNSAAPLIGVRLDLELV